MRERQKRVAALLLSSFGLGALVMQALTFDAPLSASMSLARKFWRANTASRFLNSRLFRGDLDFALALLQRDRTVPRSTDVLLVLPLGMSEKKAEEERRKAAYVLAPRRVVVRREALEGEVFRIRPIVDPR